MKKLLMLLLAFTLLFTAAASAEEAAAPWYELSAENSVVTVRLPGNSKDGMEWSVEISAPDVMEPLLSETITGDSEGMAGAATTYVASYKAKDDQQGSVSLIFRYGAEGDETSAKTWVLETEVAEDGTISLLSAYQQEKSADWCTLEQDGFSLKVTLPSNASTGYSWTADILDPDMLVMTQEAVVAPASQLLGAAGTYTATFEGTFDKAGSTEINFAYSRGGEELAESRSVDVFVNEANELFIEWVSVLTIL